MLQLAVPIAEALKPLKGLFTADMSAKRII
jgi:hypothetical protein